MSVFSFGAILWRLSGPLTLGTVTLPRALFWVVIFYVLAATIIAFVIGRPLIRLSFMNELLNAGFRYALVRLRDASAAVGLYRGENAERNVLNGRLSAVMDNYGNWRNRMVLFTGWNLSMSQAIDPLPFIVQAPRLFARSDITWRYLPVGDRISHDPQRTVVLPGCLRLVRELSRGDHPPGRIGRRELGRPQVHPGVNDCIRGRRARGRRRRSPHSRRRAPHPRS